MFLANILTVGLLFVAISAVSLALQLLNYFHKDIRICLMHTACALVGLWSLGLVLVRVAPSYDQAFFWQRISALGWTTVYSVLFHLFLILHKNRFCQKWWAHVLVYLPALLSLTAFSLLPELAQKTQHLVLVNSAWVVLPVMDFWNLLFQFYCTISVVLSSFLLLRLGCKSKDPAQKRQGALLAFSLLLAIASGIFLDRIFVPQHLPELSNLAPGIALLPMTLFYRFIRTHQEFWGLKPRQFAQNVAKGEILSETDKVALYRFLGGIYILAGFGYAALAIIAQRPSLENRIFWGVMIIFLGMGLHCLTVLEIPEKRRDTLVGAVLSFSAFLLWFEITRVLGRSDIFIALSLLPFILPSILSGSRWTFAMVSAVFFSTQAYLWISPQLMGNPPETVLTQILVTALSGLVIIVLLFVRQVHLRRLEENRDQLNAQELIASVSSQFIGSQLQDVEENLRKVLYTIATKLNMPWAFLGVFGKDGSLRYRVNFGSSTNGVESDELTFLKTRIKRGVPLWVDDKTLPPADKEHLSKLLAREKLHSMMFVPLQNDETMLGILILGAYHRMPWSGHKQESLKILSNVLTEALVRVKAEERLEHMALHDALTGLPNRTLFMDRLQKSLQYAKRTGKLVAVVFLDLDSFKVINDSEGHKVGDQILKHVAQRLTGCVREYDTVGRFGGDEFLVLLDGINHADETLPVVERVLREFHKPFFVGNQEFFITASCGIALYPEDGKSPEELIQAADLAMYAAKAKGEGHYAFCSPHLKAEAQQRQTLISGLYKAMHKEELVIYYQPQVDVATGNIVGIEALLRWQHPEFGLLLPASFIPLAEQKGLIVPIGEWVLQKACSLVTSWQKKGIHIPRLAVNLSPVQLRDPQLVEKVRRILEDTSLSPGVLELEITESAIFHNPDEVIALLQNLKHLGVRIALDDFGVGYSSILRLKMLPVDRIKLDQRFFHNAPYNLRDRSIAENMIHLARSIDAAVIAEGVETEQQLEFVVKQGCYEVQGYYYYHPLPPEEIEILLLKGKKG
ncbi:MAG: EAL domain-containing protein [Candidatus Atribacteria bacterium]|nr:EAL domain-containing protein [Candidatus Atribacteria bacterium]